MFHEYTSMTLWVLIFFYGFWNVQETCSGALRRELEHSANDIIPVKLVVFFRVHRHSFTLKSLASVYWFKLHIVHMAGLEIWKKGNTIYLYRLVYSLPYRLLVVWICSTEFYDRSFYIFLRVQVPLQNEMMKIIIGKRNFPKVQQICIRCRTRVSWK